MKFLTSLRQRLGDVWYYTLMLFFAQRFGDFLNVFVGLYLVPKYLGVNDLGAVLPLTSFASILSLPAYIFALAFTKELADLSARREYGKMKSLMRGVFVTSAIVLASAFVIVRFVFPIFLDRMRLADGSLSTIILGCTLVGSLAPFYGNALQALKKFSALSAMGIVSAPLRFLTMLALMPFRAVAGYIIGQHINSVFTIFASFLCLRKELSVKAEPYWNAAVVKRFALYFIAIALFIYGGSGCGLVEQSAFRGRLPALESAAFYMVTRFSDIAGFISATLMSTLFPYTAELAVQGKSTRPLVVKSAIATLAFCALVAIPFFFIGEPIMRLLPDGDKYAAFAWAIPWMIGITALTSVQHLHTNTEISAGRFRFLRWWVPLSLVYPALLALAPLPDLQTALWWLTGVAVVRFACSAIELGYSRARA